MDIKKIKEDLKDVFKVRDIKNGFLVNNCFVCYNMGNNDMPVAILKKDGKIVFTDMGETYKNLLENEINLDDEEIIEYKEKVFNNFGVSMNDKKEIISTISEDRNVVMAMCSFIQVLILLNNIDLQFEEE